MANQRVTTHNVYVGVTNAGQNVTTSNVFVALNIPGQYIRDTTVYVAVTKLDQTKIQEATLIGIVDEQDVSEAESGGYYILIKRRRPTSYLI